MAGVTGGLAAHVAIVLAHEAGMPALTLVDLAGAQRRAVQSFDNSRCIADLRFDAAPAETLIAGAAARDAALHILALQAVVTAHEQTGGAEALMEVARDYAVTRKAFGQPTGAFQRTEAGRVGKEGCSTWRFSV